MLKHLFRLASPAGAKARLSILIFHRVLIEPDPLFPDEMHATHFDEVCGWLKSWFNVLPLDAAVVALKAGTLPARAACISFDDGYADNYQVALPILQRHGLTATFFIATGFLDGGRMWNDTVIESVRSCELPNLDLSNLGLGCYRLESIDDRRAAIAALIAQIKYLSVGERVDMTLQVAQVAGARLPCNLMMTSQEVRAMRNAGMQIGAHTVSHPILARLSRDEAIQEIRASQLFLEQLLGEAVGLFAYPNGKPGEDYLPDSVGVVRKLGFDAAVSTKWGASCTGDDVFQIRRFTPWDRTKLRFGIRLLLNLRSR
jgi:peptidoglycan/xylan/chitin deacetylase (PgdA/CDA1 family)